MSADDLEKWEQSLERAREEGIREAERMMRKYKRFQFARLQAQYQANLMVINGGSKASYK